MRSVWERFYYSVADALIPNVFPPKKHREKNKFAVILSGGETLTADDINKISQRCNLTPLFFALSREGELDLSRSYARSLDTTVVIPKNHIEFAFAAKECAFSINESALGGILSFFSHTPAYLNSGCKDCRTLIGELTECGISPPLFMPYTKNRAYIINKVRVTDYEFYVAIKKLRTLIGTKLLEFFDV